MFHGGSPEPKWGNPVWESHLSSFWVITAMTTQQGLLGWSWSALAAFLDLYSLAISRYLLEIKKRIKTPKATFLVDHLLWLCLCFSGIKPPCVSMFYVWTSQKNGRLSLLWDGTAVSSRFQIELPGSVAKLRNVLVPRTWWPPYSIVHTYIVIYLHI